MLQTFNNERERLMRNRRGERDTEDICKKIRQLERKCMVRELKRERKKEIEKEKGMKGKRD